MTRPAPRVFPECRKLQRTLGRRESRAVGRRTEIQIALLVAGVLVWGYGQRTDTPWLEFTGIGFFAVATALRFLKPRKKD